MQKYSCLLSYICEVKPTMSTKRKSSQKGRAAKRAHVMNNSSTDDDDLDMGILEKVTLKNFMCHSQLTMSFSSNVNFIVGKNGSGKSAIITAIVVGLGGKASSTSRGSSLKTLIKEGSNSATVEITMRNKGKEAYKKHLFGDSITIERKIHVDGQTCYKIKNADGKIITNKKEDLVQILDQFNIQVDNPLTCLNQEMSKHFLHSKSESDKYKFFMKSTQLEQMSMDYDFVQKHRLTMQETLKRKEKVLPELEKEVLAKEQKFRDLSTLQELKNKIDNLKGELAWAHVIHLEHSLKPSKRQLEQEQKRTAKYTQMVDKSKHREKEARALFTQSQNSVKEYMENAKELDPLRNVKKQEFDKIRQSHRQLEHKVKSLVKQRHDAASDMKKMEKRISDLMETVNTNIEAEKKKREKALGKLHNELKDLTARLENISKQKKQFENAMENCKEIIQENKKDAQRISTEKHKTASLLKSLTSDRKNRLQLFGVKMPRFVQRIEEEWKKKRFRLKPRGPIGACITLKDANMAVPVESAIRSHISAFVVDNHEDMKLLSQLRSSVFTPKEASQITIYTSKFSKKVHDVSRGKAVHNPYKCVLDLLNIEDPVVANCLIDMGSIETILVIPNLKDAMRIMQNSARPPAGCTQVYTGDGDEVFEDRFYSNPREPVSRFLKADVDDEIRRLQEEIQGFDMKIKNIEVIVQSKTKESQISLKELHRLERTKCQLVNRLKEVQVDIRGLESVEEVSPPDVKDLLDEVNNYKQQIVSFDAMIYEESENLKSSKELLTSAQSNWKQYDGEMRKLKDALDESRENISKVENDLEKAKSDRSYYEESLKNHNHMIQDMLNKLNKENSMVDTERERAALIHRERINTRRTPSNIENEIRQIERRVAQDEQQHGQREQIIKEYYEVKEQYKSIKNGMQWVQTFIREVDSYLKQRQQSFIQMRVLISVRCRMAFDTLLSQRGFTGKMHFSHTDRLLQISVQPGEDGITTNDMRALSGGERSFSTVCFILSLWEEIESPFRCLDEFDVFMDMANRRVAMEMMLEIAMNDKLKQFIFLTPHDISSLPQSCQIRVWKMADPERSQNTASSNVSTS
ncbi:structural maintenance of chromosomes protein 6-like isoform X2 [Styela clava]|uniref:structural maintenance of chromosomes protein 6-like isoform X1 n=2 Tax=Styela clava TaxID=7725 RepID=UPI00193A491F|nr:structural maintenance of chromosomes protein 6-like isoform X1 [Styela clava]